MQLKLSRWSGKPSTPVYEDTVKLEIQPFHQVESDYIRKLNEFKASCDWESLSSEEQTVYSNRAMVGTVLTAFTEFNILSEDEVDADGKSVILATVKYDAPADPDEAEHEYENMAEQLIAQDLSFANFVFEHSFTRSNFYDTKARQTVKKSSTAGDSTAP